MTRTLTWMFAVALAGSTLIAGCGYPETKMEAVGQTQMQTEHGQQPANSSSATDDEAKKKTNG